MNRSKSIILGSAIILMVVIGYAVYLHRGPMKRISDENETLVAEIDQLKTASEKLKADSRARLHEKLRFTEELERKNAELEAAVSRIKNEKHVTEADTEKLVSQIKEEKERAEAGLQSKVADLENQIAQKERDLQTSRKEVEKLHGDVALLESSQETLSRKTEDLSRQLLDSTNQVEALRKELEAKKEEVTKAARENETMRKQMNLVAREKDQLEQTKTELENQLAESRSRYEAISRDLASKDGKILEMEKTHQSLVSQIDRQKKEKEELERLKNGLRNQLGMTQSQIESLSMAAEAKEEQLKSKEKQLKSMEKAMQELSKQFERQIKEREIQISALEDKLNIRLLDKILFASGSADITPAGQRVLKSLATELKEMDGFEIAVSGHTDNIPLGPKIKELYHDNLGLSVSRAAAVSRVLREMGVPPENLSAVGHSMYRPVAGNDTEEGRQQNRRVEIMLAPLR